jgi:MFS family permease
MHEHPIERRRLGLAVAALVAATPAAIFFAAAIGRQLQPTEHQPARTLEAIFEAFANLSPMVLAALVVAGPLLALGIGGYLVVAEWRSDPNLRTDTAAFAVAGGRLLRRPAFVIGLVVAVVAALMTAFLVVHAIAG